MGVQQPGHDAQRHVVDVIGEVPQHGQRARRRAEPHLRLLLRELIAGARVQKVLRGLLLAFGAGQELRILGRPAVVEVDEPARAVVAELEQGVVSRSLARVLVEEGNLEQVHQRRLAVVREVNLRVGQPRVHRVRIDLGEVRVDALLPRLHDEELVHQHVDFIVRD